MGETTRGGPAHADATGDRYYQTKWRKTLLLAIPFGALAFVVGWLLEHPSGQATAYDLITYPVMAVVMMMLWAMLAASERALRFVVLTIIGGSSVFFLGKLMALLFFSAPDIDIQHQMTETFYWVPVVYLLSFVLPGVNMGRWFAITFTVAALIVSALFVIPEALAGGSWGAVYALIQFNLANSVLLALTSAFISFKEAYTRTQARAEVAERYAYSDSLTLLPNRHSLHERLDAVVKRAKAQGDKIALLFIDIDGFKVVNDTLGHEAGDDLLKEFGRRLRSMVRRDDFVARISGDEFVLIAEGTETLQDAYFIAQKVQAATAAPFNILGQAFNSSVSIGISLFPDDARDASELLKHADSAMYRVKRSGKNGARHYLGATDADLARQQQLERDLRIAIQEGQITLDYQPLHNLRSGDLKKLEALARWKHPEWGQVPPTDFIPIAERSGLIVPLGSWVLGEACRQAKEWRNLGLEGFKVAVNVSPLQFSHPGFLDTVLRALESNDLPAEFLELELTESIVMHGVEHVNITIARLQRLGVSIAIDDFGTGYSSLAYLRDLPIDSVKIDRSFVRDLGSPRKGPQFSLALVEAIMSLAAHLDLEVIAEGIETGAQCELLRQLGCEIGQGYYFSEPMPAAELQTYLCPAPGEAPAAAPALLN